MTNLAFDPEALFGKAKVYMERALAEERESELYPFWLSLSLEFLSRSTLACISPTLLADMSPEGDHLLYALNLPSGKLPKSVNVRIVFERLTKINIDFSKKDEKLCASVTEQRNVELHSGVVGFEEFPARIWESDYYRVTDILLRAQGKSLEDLYGAKEAIAAKNAIVLDEEDAVRSVNKLISASRDKFLKLSNALQEERKHEADAMSADPKRGIKRTQCPACGAFACISGTSISVSDAKLEGDVIIEETRYQPEKLTCFSCKLEINSFAELKAINLAGQFTTQSELDPVEFHSIDIADRYHSERE